jgi:hypothetical protein
MNEKEQEIIDYIMREVVRRSDKQITEDTPSCFIRTIH